MPREKVWKGASIHHAPNKLQTRENEQTISKGFIWKLVLLTKADPGDHLHSSWTELLQQLSYVSKPLSRRGGKNSKLPRVHLIKLYFLLEIIHWKVNMKLVRSLFFVLESTGIGGDEIPPLKFEIHKWSISGQQRISQTESQAPGIVQIGFYIKFVKVTITFKVFVAYAMWLIVIKDSWTVAIHFYSTAFFFFPAWGEQTIA